jgi:hypothetical protein
MRGIHAASAKNAGRFIFRVVTRAVLRIIVERAIRRNGSIRPCVGKP